MKRNHKNKRRSVPVPVTSMGDIAFLLIIFFLVCSEEAKEKSLDIEPPSSAFVEKAKVSIVARVGVDRTGEIFLDGLRVGSPKDVEWGIRAMLTRTVADEQRHVQFTCDKALPRERFEPVLQAIAEAGGIIEAVGEKEE